MHIEYLISIEETNCWRQSQFCAWSHDICDISLTVLETS